MQYNLSDMFKMSTVNLCQMEGENVVLKGGVIKFSDSQIFETNYFHHHLQRIVSYNTFDICFSAASIAGAVVGCVIIAAVVVVIVVVVCIQHKKAKIRRGSIVGW